MFDIIVCLISFGFLFFSTFIMKNRARVLTNAADQTEKKAENFHEESQLEALLHGEALRFAKHDSSYLGRSQGDSAVRRNPYSNRLKGISIHTHSSRDVTLNDKSQNDYEYVFFKVLPKVYTENQPPPLANQYEPNDTALNFPRENLKSYSRNKRYN
jgi:hypothetical protein